MLSCFSPAFSAAKCASAFRQLPNKKCASQLLVSSGCDSTGFRRAHAVPRDVDHVIDAPGDPVIAVAVASAAVAGEILALVGREISLLEAGVIAIDGTHLPRPGFGDAEIALAFTREHIAIGVD